MSLRRETKVDSLPTTVSSDDADRRFQELWRIMNDVGIPRMTTHELEEWTYLMAESLEGKGDGPIRELSTETANQLPYAV